MDEVGRGAWAGPLVVGAVSLKAPIIGLKDSKLLSKKSREIFAKEIYSQAVFVGIGWVSSTEIDNIGLAKAMYLAFERAVDGVAQDSRIIIDGSINYLPNYPGVECLVKADQLINEVSAASIVAKVARDDYMKKLALDNPDYGFENHVGYGTKKHIENISKLGITVHHRTSFKPLRGYI